MTDVQLRFQGSSTGAVGAAEQTAAANKTVKAEAGAARVPLRGLDGDILQGSRGAVAGWGAFWAGPLRRVRVGEFPRHRRPRRGRPRDDHGVV